MALPEKNNRIIQDIKNAYNNTYSGITVTTATVELDSSHLCPFLGYSSSCAEADILDNIAMWVEQRIWSLKLLDVHILALIQASSMVYT